MFRNILSFLFLSLRETGRSDRLLSKHTRSVRSKRQNPKLRVSAKVA
jgi:hypothetical protein